jgi:hypothetical protein
MIGLNPNARGGYLHNNIALGAITLGIGDNRELGGNMESDFSAKCTILEPTLELDDKCAIKNGKLMI